MVRFLLDEHVTRIFEHTLTARGHVAEQAKDRFGERTEDSALLEWCNENAFVFVTNNAHDFAVLHERRRHNGILLYRQQELPIADPEGVARTIDTIISQFGTEGISDELIELDEWYSWLHG